MQLPPKWRNMPLLWLIYTAAHCARMIRTANKLPEEREKGREARAMWMKFSKSHRSLRRTAVRARAKEVAQLAQLIGLPDYTEERVRDDPFETVRHIDNLIRSRGCSCEDEETEEDSDTDE